MAISIFVRKISEKKSLGSVSHSELFGKREDKFKILNESNIQNVKWKKLNYSEPYYFFVPKDFRLEGEYKKGFKVDELFDTGSSGMESAKDDFIIKFSEEDSVNLKNFIEMHTDKEIAEKYNLKLEKAGQVKSDAININSDYTRILYRPFDVRFTLYTPNSQGVWWRPKSEVMENLIKQNIALITCRQQTSFDFQHIFLSNTIAERCSVSLQTGEVSYIFPLYIYKDNSRVTNFKKEIVNEIEKIVGKTNPEDIFDYIYAVLHSPSYREKYKEFLKIDFPRVPYPNDEKIFRKLVAFGGELRSLHLFESPKVSQFITTYPISGTDVIEKLIYKDGKVFINKDQYFGNVPEIAWNFYIGGYQPAQKWLKDRKGRTLTNTDFEHYQKIIVVLVETERIMKEIDKIKI